MENDDNQNISIEEKNSRKRKKINNTTTTNTSNRDTKSISNKRKK